jgi:precorrin-2/cobalt-factor-2 C20-methyltransferase
MKKPVSFLSLGPGDPELLTLKVVKTLREADIVVVPSTADRSRATEIIREWCDESRMYRYELPMLKDRSAVRKVYDDICQQVVARYNEGRRIAIVVEGDVSIYASIHYVLDELKRMGIPVIQQSGIPSFIAAAAMADLSLISGQQRLVVLPGDADGETLEQQLSSNHVVVIMKLSQCAEALKDFLRQHPAVVCHYFENVGTTEAFHTTQCDEILSRQHPYFSLCILFPA